MFTLAGCGGGDEDTQPVAAGGDSSTAVNDAQPGADADATMDGGPGDAGGATSCTAEKCTKSEGAAATCQEWTCDQAGACVSVQSADKTPCEDESDCTPASQCTAGKCAGDPVLCDCGPADVSACWSLLGLDQGNKCKGTPVCLKEEKDGKSLFKCGLNAASVVVCASTNDTECLKSICNPASGQMRRSQRVLLLARKGHEKLLRRQQAPDQYRPNQQVRRRGVLHVHLRRED